MFRRWAFAFPAVVLMGVSNADAAEFVTRILEYFPGRWECRSPDGTVLGRADWKAVAGGKAVAGTATVGPEGEGYMTAGWDAGENKWVHTWFAPDGASIRIEVVKCENDTFSGPIRVVDAQGKIAVGECTNHIVDQDHFVITQTIGGRSEVTHFHRITQADGEKVFREYAELAVGGTWTTTINGQKLEHTYTLLDGGKFVQLTGKGGPAPYLGIIGVDPNTGECTWWNFNENGGTGIATMTLERDGVWLLEGSGRGPSGANRYRGRVTRPDADTINEECLEDVFNGEKQQTGTFVWKRRR